MHVYKLLNKTIVEIIIRIKINMSKKLNLINRNKFIFAVKYNTIIK